MGGREGDRGQGGSTKGEERVVRGKVKPREKTRKKDKEQAKAQRMKRRKPDDGAV